MSGHSKWSTIKRQKGVADAKRGQQFTKLANAITVAAKSGGENPEANIKLRLSIEAAKAANMPKENINRAIERGTDKQASGGLEEIIYEAYGPHGIALLIQAASDNRQRTAANIRSLVERSGGSMGGPGSVSWMFTPAGEIEVPLAGKTYEEVVLEAADLGAEEVEEAGDSALVYTRPMDLEKIKSELLYKGFALNRAELIARQLSVVRLDDFEKARQVISLVEKLEDLDDVQNIFSNFDIEEKVLENVV